MPSNTLVQVGDARVSTYGSCMGNVSSPSGEYVTRAPVPLLEPTGQPTVIQAAELAHAILQAVERILPSSPSERLAVCSALVARLQGWAASSAWMLEEDWWETEERQTPEAVRAFKAVRRSFPLPAQVAQNPDESW